jgi:alkanesulfonate monooxygenase SsuD/methylene tetrahydromethanopterin reductase-like flavin-dependent oxidoreductase (luciferase family)
MLGITVRHADEWNTWGGPADAASQRAALIAACEKAGRDPATMHTSVNAFIDFGNGSAPAGRPVVAGSPEQLIDQFGQYSEAGYDEFNLPDWNLGDGTSERADTLARIKAEVIDKLPA